LTGVRRSWVSLSKKRKGILAADVKHAEGTEFHTTEYADIKDGR
jgi:hypothetical protein